MAPQGAASPAVTDNVADRRYEVTVEGHTAHLVYARRPSTTVLVHTEVPPALRGRGVGGVLAKHALEAARAEGVRVIAQCPFVKAYLRRHPEYGSFAQ
jgi:predicted GNAT family acetyltransferase